MLYHAPYIIYWMRAISLSLSLSLSLYTIYNASPMTPPSSFLHHSSSVTPSSFSSLFHNHHPPNTTSIVFSFSSSSRTSTVPPPPSHYPAYHSRPPRRQRHGQCQCQGRNEKAGEIGIEVLEEFIQLNLGQWSGSFTQYDVQGNVLQYIPTRLAANSYGRGEQVSLYQTLNIKQAPPKTFISGEENVETDDWAEYKMDETNILTIDRQQQVGYFPSKRAYTASHRTAEMLDRVIRAGVLGEDGDDLDETPPGVKVPSRRPALVCESCLYSKDGESRVRAFHVVDPRGLLDFIGVFQERKDNGCVDIAEDASQGDQHNRLDALLGSWTGHSVTRRTGIYGSTLFEEDVNVTFRLEDDGTLIQDINNPRGSMHLTGASYGSLVKFEKGLQMTLLPGGMAMASPMNVGKSVGGSQAFYFEFSWIYAPGKRQRLVRTYDTDGVVVSTTFIDETKL